LCLSHDWAAVRNSKRWKREKREKKERSVALFRSATSPAERGLRRAGKKKGRKEGKHLSSIFPTTSLYGEKKGG